MREEASWAGRNLSSRCLWPKDTAEAHPEDTITENYGEKTYRKEIGSNCHRKARGTLR